MLPRASTSNVASASAPGSAVGRVTPAWRSRRSRNSLPVIREPSEATNSMSSPRPSSMRTGSFRLNPTTGRSTDCGKPRVSMSAKASPQASASTLSSPTSFAAAVWAAWRSAAISAEEPRNNNPVPLVLELMNCRLRVCGAGVAGPLYSSRSCRQAVRTSSWLPVARQARVRKPQARRWFSSFPANDSIMSNVTMECPFSRAASIALVFAEVAGKYSRATRAIFCASIGSTPDSMSWCLLMSWAASARLMPCRVTAMSWSSRFMAPSMTGSPTVCESMPRHLWTARAAPQPHLRAGVPKCRELVWHRSRVRGLSRDRRLLVHRPGRW